MALAPVGPRVSLAGIVRQSDEEKRALEELEEHERAVAAIGLDMQRGHEWALRDMYVKRHRLCSQVTDFWSSIFMNPPNKLYRYIKQDDSDLLQYVTKFFVERHEISQTGEHGEPRSMRIIFNFAPNEFIENHELVKVLQYRQSKQGWFQGFTSEPVQIRWKSRMVDLTKGLGQNAWLLWQAEKAIEQYPLDEFGQKVTREELFQHARVMEDLRQRAASSDSQPSFFDWFYYRGIDVSELGESKQGNGVGEDGMLKAEIFPDGERLTEILTERLWPDALDLYNEAIDLGSPEPEPEPQDAMMIDPENLPPKA